MNTHLNTTSLASSSSGVAELRAAFANRLGRELTDTEQSFLEFMFREGG